MIFDINPWTELQRVQRELDTVFNHGSSNATFPLVNVYDVKDNLIIEAELPGMTDKDINITFSNGVLSISGDRKQSVAYKEMSVFRSERSIGEFEKSFRVPTKINQNKISASFINGVLSITLSKAEEAKPRQISIDAHQT
jgi:HSP20 family protein